MTIPYTVMPEVTSFILPSREAAFRCAACYSTNDLALQIQNKQVRLVCTLCGNHIVFETVEKLDGRPDEH